MAETIASLSLVKPVARCCTSIGATTIAESYSFSRIGRPFSTSRCSQGRKNQFLPLEFSMNRRRVRVNALPDWPLMAVLVEHVEGQRDIITQKTIWHLSDQAIKNVYTFYIMFTCWGCCFFGATKDPYYDSEDYRKDGGDGSYNWVYEKQDDIEEKARAELWREELIEEIEQKVGSLKELEEAVGSKDLLK